MEAENPNQVEDAGSLRWLQMAHDLKSPLTVLNMVTPKIQNVMGAERDLMEEAIRRIQLIVAEILDHKKVDSEPWTLSEMCKLVQHKQIEFPEAKFMLSCRVHKPFQTKVPGAVLGRVISNLLNNAAEANGGGGEIYIRISNAAEGCRIEIEDQGPGLPLELKPTLGQLGASTKTSEPVRRGIGLFSAFQAIQKYGGRIVLHDRNDQHGTTVSLSV